MSDPDLDGIDAVLNTETVFEQIQAEMARRARADVETETYRLTRWPDWEVTYRLPATASELAQIAREAAGRLKKDAAAMDRLTLARCCVGLRFAGQDLVEDDGTPMTWASPQVRSLLRASSSTEALTVAYRGGVADGAGDGEITQHAGDLTDKAGFGDSSQVWTVDKAAPDPTPGR